jgi:hypothetical protein
MTEQGRVAGAKGAAVIGDAHHMVLRAWRGGDGRAFEHRNRGIHAQCRNQGGGRDGRNDEDEVAHGGVPLADRPDVTNHI